MGSDNNDIQHSVPDSHFNPRSRMGSDHPHDVFQYVSSIFQSTPPHGERQYHHGHYLLATYYFNPRPRMGSDHKFILLLLRKLDFNPRPRMGSDASGYFSRSTSLIFQSTPPHGERPILSLGVINSNDFNPRPRMGSDNSAGGFKLYRLYFNPRPRMGSDTIPNHHPALISLFQSTPPHGERRHRQLSKEYHLDNFNPRPRMGSDGNQRINSPIDVPFQSTPPHGERRAMIELISASSLFQSTPPHGERRAHFIST